MCCGSGAAGQVCCGSGAQDVLSPLPQHICPPNPVSGVRATQMIRSYCYNAVGLSDMKPWYYHEPAFHPLSGFRAAPCFKGLCHNAVGDWAVKLCGVGFGRSSVGGPIGPCTPSPLSLTPNVDLPIPSEKLTPLAHPPPPTTQSSHAPVANPAPKT